MKPHQAFVCLAIALVGCAHYGFANSPRGDREQRSVEVHTVQIESHSGANAATLTNDLVHELVAAGFADASWAKNGEAKHVLKCAVGMRDDSELRGGVHVAVRTTCKLDGADFGVYSGEALLAVSETDRTLGRSRATEDAARASFARVADALAVRLVPDRT